MSDQKQISDTDFIKLCMQREETKLKEAEFTAMRRQLDQKICDAVGRLQSGTAERSLPGVVCKVVYKEDYSIPADQQAGLRALLEHKDAPQEAKACFRTKTEVALANYKALETVNPVAYKVVKDFVLIKPASPAVTIDFVAAPAPPVGAPVDQVTGEIS